MILDRRRFLAGAWPHSEAPAGLGGRHDFACAILVRVHPVHAETARAAISTCDGVTVVHHEATRLQLSLSDAAAADLARTLDTVTRIGGVLSATVASHPRHPRDGAFA